MLTPIELIKACVDGMAERGFGRIVNITSGAVKAPSSRISHNSRRREFSEAEMPICRAMARIDKPWRMSIQALY
jgi:NAD(P)-dependent dehydrogenase (short-subunit alcohol dehydrogenase family)